MIVTTIIGGLGNQLFQYAIGRSLAHINNTRAWIELTKFDKDGFLKKL